MYGGAIVECAQVDELFERPQHPYTMGLLGAVPSLLSDDEEDRPLVSIGGTPPDQLQELSRGPFANRCDYVFQRWRQKRPSLLSVGPQHDLACFYDLSADQPSQVSP